ncbi:MAG: S-adenosylmethionine:tRNA ribosyltransferase-isomerase [Williamsia sp.]|nr:S-adenosylmethionine:tRNA ribosyltransferase-isomerase [Williamsia sp.]
MQHPKHLLTNAYTYTLPDDRIARFPLAARDQSKLLIYQKGEIREDRFYQLDRYLPTGSLLVFNNTRVIPARLLFRKQSGGVIEIFMLEPEQKEAYGSLYEKNLGTIRWKCLIGGASKWKRGQVMQKEWTWEGREVQLEASIAERKPDCFVIQYNWRPAETSFSEILQEAGSIPIPPYLKREAASEDTERYQTIYAREQGSVAAPTAGLHFTDGVFAALAAKGIQVSFITLHVGAGTFASVKSRTLEGHAMHAEWMNIELAFVRQLIAHQGPVIAVGTTSLRTLESLYWLGTKCWKDPLLSPGQLTLDQWDPYEEAPRAAPEPKQALQALEEWMVKKGLQQHMTETRLLIAPPYQPRLAQALITNFHQPGSTLLLLVAAVTKNKWKEIYDWALAHEFRFLSYGDGCLIYFD